MEPCAGASELAESVEQLRSQLESGDEEQIQQAVGVMTLLLSNAIQQEDAELFQSILREAGTWVQTTHARWMLNSLKRDLPPEQVAWMDGAIASILSS